MKNTPKHKRHVLEFLTENCNPIEPLPQPQNPANATNRATWFEIGAVVLLVCASTVSSLGCSLFWGNEYRELAEQQRQAKYQTATEYETRLFESMVIQLRLVPVVLIVMWRSGKGWAYFGLTKPKIGKDILIGLGLWFVVVICDGLISLTFHRRLPAGAIYALAVPWHRGILLLGDCCAIGFSEELVFRAYLIPRLAAVTGATWKGILLSIALFGFVHLYKGYVGVIHTVVAALIWSIGFCITRRVWPVAISHAILDFIIGTHVGATVGL